jgi:hypothetical protein
MPGVLAGDKRGCWHTVFPMNPYWYIRIMGISSGIIGIYNGPINKGRLGEFRKGIPIGL